ncbi:glycopeptide [Infundibulicybe gibba]|nr:glycopeptide [Infundibulicybe gibba]
MYNLYQALASVAVFLSVMGSASAETHTVTFQNKFPMLMQNFRAISTGRPYVSNGPLISAIAYLQTGPCLQSGENCAIVETTLRNPPSPGAGSSTDISLIPPHKFNVKTGFHYTHGCDNQGTTCDNANCPKAYRKTDDNFALVNCQANDVNLVITFC